MATETDAEFSALVERQSRFVFRVAYAVLLNSYDTEDAVQETFLKLYRNGGWKHLRKLHAASLFIQFVLVAAATGRLDNGPGRCGNCRRSAVFSLMA
ncbi:MAG TPA: sigma factor [Terracidiphilus sp.]